MAVSVVVALQYMSVVRQVGFLVINESKKLTLPLVSWVGLSWMLLWIVLMCCSSLS